MKVVLFDDELCQRQAFYRMPEMELRFYDDADDAVRVVRAERPDVVLMDFAMHAMQSGIDAIACLRKQEGARPARRLRIIAISNDAVANQRMLAAGADDAVPKTHVRSYLQRLHEADRLAQLREQ